MEKEELYLKGAKIGEIRNNCYVSYRTHLHMFHIFNDGFGISEKVLDYLFTKNVKHILINFEDRFLLNSDIDTFLVKAKEYSDNGDKQLILEGQFWNKEIIETKQLKLST